MFPLASTLLLLFLTSDATAQQSLPNITLPWGTWQATKYDPENKFYTFQNIRFAQAPIGPLRFMAPQFPENVSDPHILMDAEGASCMQVDRNNSTCVPGVGMPAPSLDELTQSEDCLFLDMYVPDTFDPNNPNLSVVVWIYGGAFIFGSKDQDLGGPYNSPFYDGTSTLTASHAEIIYVAGNYRLGAFGWLAGTTMEQEALPNAGLYDQRLLFQWVQKYINLVGGNSSKVTAWGESAGASSILHHLVAKDPSNPSSPLDPLFTRAALQSPAYQWQWDRSGTLDNVAKAYAHSVNCTSISCQNLTTDVLQAANQLLYQEITPCTGLFPVGPAIDNITIMQLPPVALAQGNFWPLDSLIVSHVSDEAQLFVPAWVKTPDNFTQFVHDFIPENTTSMAQLRQDIESQYPSSAYGGNQVARVKEVIQDSVFTCNTRQMYDAYHNHTHVYMFVYDLGDFSPHGTNYAVHASDLVSLYFTADWRLAAYLREKQNMSWIEADLIVEDVNREASIYQAYWAAHALTGDPNGASNLHTRLTVWPEATDNVTNVQNALLLSRLGFFYNNTTDTVNTAAACSYWEMAAHMIENMRTLGDTGSLLQNQNLPKVDL